MPTERQFRYKEALHALDKSRTESAPATYAIRWRFKPAPGAESPSNWNLMQGGFLTVEDATLFLLASTNHGVRLLDSRWAIDESSNREFLIQME